MPGQELDQGLLSSIWNPAPQRVVEIRDHEYRPDGIMFDGKLERFQADAIPRVSGDFQRPQTMHFKCL